MSLIVLLLLPFLGSCLAAVLPHNARNAESLLAGLVALIGTVSVAMLYPQIAHGGVIREEFLWLPSLGLGAMSAAIQVAMNWAQKSVSPTRATLIYAGEPVWAGIVGRIAGERLPAIALVGAGLIVAAVIVSELKTKGKETQTVTEELEHETEG